MSITRRGHTQDPPEASQLGQATRMLSLATVGFLINFWAWALIGPLGPTFGKELHLSSLQQSLLVALPVVVGSLGRIPVGALTDRFGARVMFPAVSALTIFPVLFVGLGGNSYARLLIGGFFLGIGGTAFAVGVPLVNSWFPPARRGLAIGIFGAGTGGTAVSAFTTIRLADAYGRSAPFILVAILLGIFTVVAALLLRTPAGRPAPGGSFLARTLTAVRMPATVQLSMLYAVGFGGFVAFSVYLPTSLRNEYGLTVGDAAARTAGFVVLAVAARPFGGWLSDRVGPIPVLAVSFTAAALFALLTAGGFSLMPLATIGYLGLAAMLGAASGACFALVAKVVPAAQVGAVTGVVGAAGGLGGFVPPLVMGALYGSFGNYRIGLLLLAVVALGAAALTWWPVKRTAQAF
ncbi:MAG: MFS transporter [Mycobacteriaceae bacterium]